MQQRNERFVERLPLVLSRGWHAYLLVTLFCLLGLAARKLAEPIMPAGYPFLSFFPAVILSSFLFGVRPGIYAGALGGLLSWYFFIAPSFSPFNAGVALAMFFYASVVAVDILLIGWMQRANYQLAVERERNRRLAENRELLFRELQHRVSNNLQVVAALIALQRRDIDHDGAAKALDQAAARLALIGKISRGLYDPTGEGQSVRGFLSVLAGDLIEASGRNDIKIAVVAPDDLTLPPDVAVPISLITAEAISNAIEHGLSGRSGGHIAVTLDHGDGGSLILRISDDGQGLRPSFDAASLNSLGLRIATTLAEQLGGQFSLEPGTATGAVATLTLPRQSV
ncbi:ATP-binding protein [Sphingobium sp. AN641]|uniref:sensor histidine kinase n=1 Tax=Sphingobium sp. AN641 TaxID=3133443 RepID=UPI0030C27575